MRIRNRNVNKRKKGKMEVDKGNEIKKERKERAGRFGMCRLVCYQSFL